MLKQPKIWLPVIGAGATLAFIGGALLSTQVKPGSNPGNLFNNVSGIPGGKDRIGAPSPNIGPLTSQTPEQRFAALIQLAQSPNSNLDRHRARYLLASDLLTAGKAPEALKYLEGLEKEYSTLTPHILIKRGQAQSAMGKPEQAIANWKAVAQNYPKDPAAAEALNLLGQKDTNFQDQAIAQYPSHPSSLQTVKERLKKNPKQLPLLMALARYDLDSKDYVTTLDRITSGFAPQLSPEDWEILGFGYWENQKYGKAADAYARSPQTALTAYRAARGLHLEGKPGGKERYITVAQNFAGTPEAGLALLRLGQMVEPKEAATYLDQVIAQYPDQTPQALLEKAKVLDGLKSQTSATQVRQYLLDKYPNTEPAGEMRWLIAQERVKLGDLPGAKQWAEATIVASPNTEVAAKAGFWAGKWAQKLGKSDESIANFQKVIKEHPQSYYAWRSASLLGWEVGDFTTVRGMQPTIVKPQMRAELPVGSAMLKELHQVGQDRDAWANWQVEYQNRQKPSMNEQLTDGIMRLGVGDNLDGIFMVGNLSDRTKPEEKQQYAALSKQANYWQALYPFPYSGEISTWSKQHGLNPMLVTALMRQESRFEAKIESSAGAKGLMQVMPDTATFIAGKLNLKKYNMENPSDNIQLGTWYLGYTHDEYQNNSMLAVASYNAGPGAVSGWLESAKSRDQDEFVEAIPYEETRGYVKSVLGNYWNYLRLYNPEIAKKVAEASPLQPKLNQ
jgi:soluble lytic murein transglycosylase